ncbi:MAG: serine hydrolase domain-containing protein [Anaerolineales bacterium]
METSNNSNYAEMLQTRISPFIQRLMRQKHITGLSVALVDEKGILATQSYGFADRHAQQPATPRTVYRIGSITKLFTGTAAMQLCEKGLLELDKPITEYVPEFSIKTTNPGDLSRITPRTLMTHHSGLPADWYENYWNDDPHAFRQVIEYLKDCTLAFPPNTVFAYSNLATSLMGIIIERVSGLSYQDYIEQNILAPLKMTDSRLNVDQVPTTLLSKAYARDHEVEEPILRDAPAGAILSNVGDMSRFLAMVLAGGNLDGAEILSGNSLTEMLSPQNADVKLDLGFQIGLNWFLSRPSLASAGRVCWHDGGSPHFFSILIGLPDVKLGVVVLSNSDGGMVNVGLIADELLKHATAVKTGEKVSGSDAQSAPVKLQDRKPTESPTGIFAAPNGIVQIFRHNNSLHAKMQGMQFSLTDTGDDWYAPRLLLFGFLPVKLASIESLRMTVRSINEQRILGMEQYGLRAPFGVEYSPVDIPASWAESLGKYQLTTQDKLPPFTSLLLTISHNALLLRLTARKAGKMSLVLKPISDTEAVVLGFGRVAGVTVGLSHQDDVKTLKMVGLEFAKS